MQRIEQEAAIVGAARRKGMAADLAAAGHGRAAVDRGDAGAIFIVHVNLRAVARAATDRDHLQPGMTYHLAP